MFLHFKDKHFQLTGDHSTGHYEDIHSNQCLLTLNHTPSIYALFLLHESPLCGSPLSTLDHLKGREKVCFSMTRFLLEGSPLCPLVNLFSFSTLDPQFFPSARWSKLASFPISSSRIPSVVTKGPRSLLTSVLVLTQLTSLTSCAYIHTLHCGSSKSSFFQPATLLVTGGS